MGDNQPISVNVRLITATNKNLQELIAAGSFREDLYFRINVLLILLPPLRERREDIPLLVETFIGRLRKRTGKPIHGLTKAAMDRILAYPFPGNVRELKSVLQYAFTIAEKGPLDNQHLPPQMPATVVGPSSSRKTIPDQRGRLEKEELIAALKQTNGNQTSAARLLDINRVTVWNRMRKYGIDVKKVINTL